MGQTTPPVNRITDRCKNITLPESSTAVKVMLVSFLQWES